MKGGAVKALKKVELEKSLDEMILATLGLLEDLHLVHKKTAFEKLLGTKIPGADITIAQFINNLFSIIKPVIAIARKNYPAFFAVLDWAEDIVRRLLQG